MTTAVTPTSSTEQTLPTTFWGRVWHRLRRDRLAMTGLAIVLGAATLALLAPLLAPYAEGAQDPGALLQSPSVAHPFGTDQLGRDLFSRVLFGARVSMVVALMTSAIAVALGTALGAVSGWVGSLFP